MYLLILVNLILFSCYIFFYYLIIIPRSINQPSISSFCLWWILKSSSVGIGFCCCCWCYCSNVWSIWFIRKVTNIGDATTAKSVVRHLIISYNLTSTLLSCKAFSWRLSLPLQFSYSLSELLLKVYNNLVIYDEIIFLTFTSNTLFKRMFNYSIVKPYVVQ